MRCSISRTFLTPETRTHMATRCAWASTPRNWLSPRACLAMTRTRPYRKALPIAEARRRLDEGAGSQWDARIVGAFLRLLETTLLGVPEPLPLPVQHPAIEKAA